MILIMEGEDLLVVSQVAVAVVGLALAAGIVVTLVRRRATGRIWVSAVPVVVIVSGTGVGAFAASDPALQLIYGAAWFGLAPLILATYPDGRFVPRWTTVPVVAALGVTAAWLISAGRLSELWWWQIFAIGEIAMVSAQVYRYVRRSSTAERESARWVVLGVLVTVEAYAVLTIASGSVASTGSASVALANFAILPLVSGLAIGIIRPGWVHADELLRVVLFLTLAVVVLGTGFWFTSIATAAMGFPAETTWITAAIVVATLAIPVAQLSAWCSELVVYRGRSSPSAAVSLLSRAIGAQGDARLLPVTVLETVMIALRVDGVRLDGPPPLRAEVGDASEIAASFEIVYQGELLATIGVPARSSESDLTARDHRVMRELALHAAPALHGARALADLADAHARLLLAREEERRALRRDLHDDLGPALSGLGLGAAAIARLSVHASPDVAQLAAHLQHDIQAAVIQTREISHDLRPPILDDRGLVEAIRHRIHGQEADSLSIRIDAPDDRLVVPAAVDLAALRIVQEAVTNVRRHARARACTVTLTLDGDELHVTVTDDGIGLPTRVRSGLGLESIRTRATELGGTAAFGPSESGGSRVHVVLPFASGGAR
ncbi:sensor histidine kinase [Leifsonia sp. Leaf264]|uniref:sensor histidine kinase n=1 Tax=Leifsonia sp. Leaf264 TaxID=1736314 RepID=UPI0006FBEF5C|nr:ATP-binding protein [Leifsonia sp. Leaf264]KQO99673.1 hypothetical protein ASF30_07110 [Leifsonia sp. Leaf264]